MKWFVTLLILLAGLSAACVGPRSRTIDAPDLALKNGISEVSPAEARAGTEAAYSQFIDVRTPEEYAGGHANRAINIPLDTLPQKLSRLEKNEPVYLICRTDNRSREAAKILVKAGFRQIVVITGGTNQWQASGMPMDAEKKTGE